MRHEALETALEALDAARRTRVRIHQATFYLRAEIMQAHQMKRGDFVSLPRPSASDSSARFEGFVTEIAEEPEYVSDVLCYRVVCERVLPELVEVTTCDSSEREFLPTVYGERLPSFPPAFATGDVPPGDPLPIGAEYHGSFLPWSIAERLGLTHPTVGSPSEESNSSEEG